MLLQIMHTIAVNSIVFRNWLNKIALRTVACTPEIDTGEPSIPHLELQNTWFPLLMLRSASTWTLNLLFFSCSLLPFGNAFAGVQIYNYCDGYDVAKLYASDITVQFGNDVPIGNIGFRVGINNSTDLGYTEYQAYSDGQANNVTASAITFGQPLSLYGQSGTYDIVEVFGFHAAFSGSTSIIDGALPICPHGWDEVHVPL